MNESIISALNWRYAVKEFDTTKKLNEQDVVTVLEAARLTPSSSGIEAWKFLVVENPELRKKIQDAAWGQQKVTGASHLIVIARRTDMKENITKEALDRTAKAQGVEVSSLDGLKGLLDGSMAQSDEMVAEWATRQTYIALGVMIETASLLNIDNCPMEGFDRSAVDEILGLKEKNLASVTILALGHRSVADPSATRAKVRRSYDEVVEVL